MTLDNLTSNLSNISKDDLLRTVGLETRRATSEVVLGTVGVLGTGILVGIGIGMMIAPKRGSELRSDLADGANRLLPMKDRGETDNNDVGTRRTQAEAGG